MRMCIFGLQNYKKITNYALFCGKKAYLCSKIEAK